MKGGGIENPAFETPGAVLGPQCYTGLAGEGADTADPARPSPDFEEGPCGWGPCSPRALQLCNNPQGYLAAYSTLAIFQGTCCEGCALFPIPGLARTEREPGLEKAGKEW